MTEFLIVIAVATGSIVITVYALRTRAASPEARARRLSQVGLLTALLSLVGAAVVATLQWRADVDRREGIRPTPTGPAMTTTGPQPSATWAEPDVRYRGKATLKRGEVLVFGREKASVFAEPTTGFEVWWDVQMSAATDHLQVLGENFLAASGPRPSWQMCQTLESDREVLEVDAGRSVFCMDLRFAGTAVVVATPRQAGGVNLDYKVWAR